MVSNPASLIGGKWQPCVAVAVRLLGICTAIVQSVSTTLLPRAISGRSSIACCKAAANGYYLRMTDEIPSAVRDYIRGVFDHADNRVSSRISTTPNIPEESLDICLIESLDEFAGPKVVDPYWAVRISTHFIGSLRHYRRYEIADIGVVVVFKKGTTVLKRKLVLLQSKRLYPSNHNVTVLDEFDYQMGLGMITRADQHETPIFSNVEFEFTANCEYGALRANSEQCTAIQEHFEATDIPVHYLFYNPVVLPWRFSYPVRASDSDLPERQFGTRLLEATDIHSRLDQMSEPDSKVIQS